MKYSELVEFDPIESVVELRAADKADQAKRLVQTFVISDRMAELLRTVVFPQLQFAAPTDNKGLLVVGNYGTGKSHLMAVISALAEHDDLVGELSNDAVADAAKDAAGRFQVIRAEAPSTQLPLRDLVCQRIERWLNDHDIDYPFPPYDQVTSNKDDFQEMMATFEAKFGDHGLLFVLDELLDYLRGRDQQALIRDLGFLREMGEVCKTTRFRFIAGVQETLFDNPRFQFVADSLKRVSQRFEQVLIVREDIAYVVSCRLLKKNASQEDKIREHLRGFTQLYGTMNERMEEFVTLFPVHPAYLGAFERVTVAEKREVLKTLSRSIKAIIDADVPADEPGLIAYDSYWAEIRENPTFRSDPTMREVIEKSKVLADRVEHAFPRPKYKPVARRVVDGLSVHRLTTGDIHTPIGATAEELRDDLCLYLELPEKDAEFLRTVIETVLKETMKTVNGQFLSVNPENGQYFLDLKKDIDFDSLIEKRGDSLSKDQLDQYYFDALARVMECADQAYVTGYRIWEYELEWRDRKAGRSGYLFFGAPNERSTAQPPRDFYVYFLQPFNTPSFTDEKKADEVFLRLKKMDEELEGTIRLYGGAREQAASASGKNREIYESKASDHLRTLTKWLRERMQAAYEVSYQGKSTSLAEAVRGKIPPGGQASVRDIVNTAGSVLLEPNFADLAPDYPHFSLLITRDNRGQAAMDALRIIGGAGVKSKNGMGVLDALELLDSDRIKPGDSRYARHVLDELGKKPPNQVLNRSELVREESTIDYWLRFRLEPEFLVVVLAALVHSGDIVLSVRGVPKIDASAIDQFGKVDLDDLVNFKHIERPKDLPIGPLKELFTLLGLPEGLIVDPNNREGAVQRLQGDVAARVKDLVTAQAKLSSGLVFWGQNILNEGEVKDRTDKIAAAKSFLEGLQAFNSAGKLKNFPHSQADIRNQKANLAALTEVQELIKLVNDVGPQTAYLETAEAVLQGDHAWRDSVKDARGEIMKKVTSPKHRADSAFQRELGRTLSDLKNQYKEEYIKLFQRCRLDANGDKKKGKLTKDTRLAQLRKLRGVEMMPTQELQSYEDRLLGLKSDWSITKDALDSSPTYNEFRPADEHERFQKRSAADQLATLEDELDTLVDNWTRVLSDNLADPTVKEKIELISGAAGRKAVQAFIKSGELPEEIDNTFVKALQEVLSGLEKVAVTTDAIAAALTKGGMPCMPQQIEDRFGHYVKSLTKGKDANKVRIVIE